MLKSTWKQLKRKKKKEKKAHLGLYSFPPWQRNRQVLVRSERTLNFVLARYLNSIEIPLTENSLVTSEHPIPNPEIPKPRKSALKSTATPTAPECQIVSQLCECHSYTITRLSQVRSVDQKCDLQISAMPL